MNGPFLAAGRDGRAHRGKQAVAQVLPLGRVEGLDHRLRNSRRGQHVARSDNIVASRGSMGVASAVTALFPAVTVMLAVVLFAERITRTQMLGYAVATAGVLVLAA